MPIVNGRKPGQGSTNRKTPIVILIMSNYDIAKEVIAGLWGNGEDRKHRLTEAGYDYAAVQSIVNSLVKDGYTAPTAPAAEDEPGELLEVDYDPKVHTGIVINIIV